MCRTVHGPVQVRAGNVAYARRYAVWGREVETLVGLAALENASTIKDVDTAIKWFDLDTTGRSSAELDMGGSSTGAGAEQ